MFFRWQQGKNARGRFHIYSPTAPISPQGPQLLRAGLRSSVAPNQYAIELRDRDFKLKGRLEPYATSLRWEWNRIGGCGRALIRIAGDYRQFRIAPDDDICIYLPDAGGVTATLWYRGFVENFTPVIDVGQNSYIDVELNGYFAWLDRIIVHDSGTKKTYESVEVSQIVQSILEDFVTVNSPINIGTIEGSTYTPDYLEFKDDAGDCLSTLFNLLGDVEYGVDQNLNFYWYNQDDQTRHKFWLGDKITQITDKADYKSIVNYIFFEGGKVGGETFQLIGSSQSSVVRYGRHETIIANGSIVTSSVARRFIAGFLKQRSIPARQTTIRLTNTPKRLEAVLPMGAVSVIDSNEVQISAIYGNTANGGANIFYGTLLSGGAGQLYGGARKDQIDRIQYDMSPENGRVNAQITFGQTLSNSRASATLKRLEGEQNAVRKRSL